MPIVTRVVTTAPPKGPTLAALDPPHREEDQRDPDRRDESGERDLKMADVVVEPLAECDHAGIRRTGLSFAQPELDEAGEVDDQEQDRVPDQPSISRYAGRSRTVLARRRAISSGDAHA